MTRQHHPTRPMSRVTRDSLAELCVAQMSRSIWQPVIAILILYLSTYYGTAYLTMESVMIKVAMVTRNHVYVDGEIFRNTDQEMLFKFNSDEIRSQLHRDGVYRVTVTGIAFPLLGADLNILVIEEVYQ